MENRILKNVRKNRLIHLMRKLNILSVYLLEKLCFREKFFFQDFVQYRNVKKVI